LASFEKRVASCETRASEQRRHISNLESRISGGAVERSPHLRQPEVR
jgi:hypothetical protein